MSNQQPNKAETTTEKKRVIRKRGKRLEEKSTGTARIRIRSVFFLLVTGSAACLAWLYAHSAAGQRPVKRIAVVSSAGEDGGAEDAASSGGTEPYIEIVEQEDDEGGIHRYEYFKSDGSWADAFEKAAAAGGYLVRINSRQEFDYIREQLSGSGFEDMAVFYIGARRETGSLDYRWADANNLLYGNSINSADHWSSSGCWMDGEPSYVDTSDGTAQNEDCLTLCKSGDEWVFNDSSQDIVSRYPVYSGKTGYIIEYEN